MDLLQKPCDATDLHVQKVMRLDIRVLEEILKKYKHIYVVHLLRDPRGILMFQQKRHSFSKASGGDPVAEGKLLCDTMFKDVTERRLLQLIPNVVHGNKI